MRENNSSKRNSGEAAGGKKLGKRPRQMTMDDDDKTVALNLSPLRYAFDNICVLMEAPEVKAIADRLIGETHAGRWKVRPDVYFLFSGEPLKVKGYRAYAQCRRVSGIHAYLVRLLMAKMTEPDPDQYNRARFWERFLPGEDGEIDYQMPDDRHVVETVPLFVITVDWRLWRLLEPEQQVALIDHELCHVDVNFGSQGISYAIRPHDSEEFVEIVDRHGAWSSDLKMMRKAWRGDL